MTAEQDIRNIEHEAGMRNVDNILGVVQRAVAVEPSFKVAGHQYTDTTGRIPEGHASILSWVRPGDDRTVEHTGFVLDETDETLTVGQSGLWRFTGFKRHVIITRSGL